MPSLDPWAVYFAPQKHSQKNIDSEKENKALDWYGWLKFNFHYLLKILTLCLRASVLPHYLSPLP